MPEQPIAPPEAMVPPRLGRADRDRAVGWCDGAVDAAVNAHALRRVLNAVAGR
jgi:hypothetical protein